MVYYVYVLQTLKDQGYYIGFTADVETRLRFHNAGLQRSTLHRIPFRLVLFEAFATKKEALRREKQIKSWKGGAAFQQLIAGK
ncbi:MAG: GIY-YIG nuclease family protein [Chitinophagaceae bacterium]|nr:GIY-YIG nuclease family protein [Chitinophagaceae bacterium]